MGQVPWEFQGDWPTFIFQPVAPDMIWYIYSSQHCFNGVLGMDLLSLGDVAPNIGQVPCEFCTDRPTFIFQPAAPDVIWHIYSHLYCSSRMVVGNCCLQRRKPLPWGRSTVSFGQIGLGSVFQGKSWGKGPSSLALPRMVHHQWPAAPDVIWHIYSHLYCSSRDGGRDLPSSEEAAPTMGQVPVWDSEQIGQPSFFSWQLLTWFDTLTQTLYCSSRDGGRDLPSSGEAAPTMGKVPCEFQVDQPEFNF